MALSESFLDDEIHPIDLVEQVADLNAWSVERVAEDQIAMTLSGQWRDYAVTLAWQPADETLRLACMFEMQPPSRACRRSSTSSTASTTAAGWVASAGGASRR